MLVLKGVPKELWGSRPVAAATALWPVAASACYLVAVIPTLISMLNDALAASFRGYERLMRWFAAGIELDMVALPELDDVVPEWFSVAESSTRHPTQTIARRGTAPAAASSSAGEPTAENASDACDCRICLQSDSVSELIAPCKCRGTMR